MRTMASSNSASLELHAINRHRPKQDLQRTPATHPQRQAIPAPHPHRQRSQQTKINCDNCGYSHVKGKCPAHNATIAKSGTIFLKYVVQNL